MTVVRRRGLAGLRHAPEALRYHGLDGASLAGRIARALGVARGRERAPVWLVLADPLSTRIFFDCGIVDGLERRLDGGLRSRSRFRVRRGEPMWAARLDGRGRALLARPRTRAGASARAGPPPRRPLARRAARLLPARDPAQLPPRLPPRAHGARVTATGCSTRRGSARCRVGPRIERAMQRWHFSPRRHVPHALLERLRRERPAIVLSNVQMQSAVPFLVAARRLGLPLVGYVASWDHTVGKGVISPHLDRYVVQNDVMRDDLVRYHDIDPRRGSSSRAGRRRTSSTRQRPREAYECAARGLRARSRRGRSCS